MKTETINHKNVLKLAKSKGLDLVSLPYAGYKDNAINELLDLTYIQRWLRDTQGLVVWVKPEISEGFEWGLFNRSFKGDIYKVATDGYCETYEECLLICINEALQLI